METRLYVGNLSYSVTEESLQEMFSKIGTVKTVSLIKDRDTGRSKGFAFVEMENQEDAQKAISQLNGTKIEDRNITVNFARPKEEGSRGGFGNRGGDRPRGGGRPSGGGHRRF
jgi:cold-inducible RNA-binding protein